MSKIRRVCLFAGPGTGKTRTARRTAIALAEKGHDVELVHEVAREWAVTDRKPIGYDQLMLLASQLHLEDIFLRKFNLIVTDSPLLLNAAYAKFYDFKCWRKNLEYALAFEEDHPSVNFWIERTVPYDPRGRYQDETAAREFDGYLQSFLFENFGKTLHIMRVDQFDGFIETAHSKISNEG